MGIPDVKLCDGSGHPAIGYGTYKVSRRARRRRGEKAERLSENEITHRNSVFVSDGTHTHARTHTHTYIAHTRTFRP